MIKRACELTPGDEILHWDRPVTVEAVTVDWLDVKIELSSGISLLALPQTQYLVFDPVAEAVAEAERIMEER